MVKGYLKYYKLLNSIVNFTIKKIMFQQHYFAYVNLLTKIL